MRKLVRSLTYVNLVLAMLLGGSNLGAVDFIRGDTNGDGAVTVADSFLVINHLFHRRKEIPVLMNCLDSSDADDDGRVDIPDVVRVLVFILGYGEPPAQPFPAPGPDLTGGPGCINYGGGSPLDDPGAALSVDGLSLGGADASATLTVKVSNSTPLSAWYGTLLDGDRLITDVPIGEVGPIGPTGRVHTFFRRDGDRIRLIFLNDGRCGGDGCVHNGPLTRIPPGTDTAILEVPVCLRPGTPAGEYPLVLEVGELVDGDSGRAIHPRLVEGTLTVMKEVRDVGCTADPSNPNPTRILFSLTDSTCVAGGETAVPFTINSSVKSQGFAFSVDFNEEVLEALPPEKLWQRPGGTPYEFERFEWNNENRAPGNAGIDEGFVVGAAIFSLTDSTSVIPPRVEAEVLKLHFRAHRNAAAGDTELRFLDGGQVTGGPVLNKLISGGQDITPALADAFVFVNGRIHIIGDVSTFIRGDSKRETAR